MSEGPYKVVMMGEEYWEVRDQSNAYVDGFSVKVDADSLAENMNLAHAHATAAAARRVRELEEALEHIVEYWNRGENNGAMSDALYHMIETAESALAGKERSDGQHHD